MFAAERLKIIEQYLKSSGHLEVTTISAMLGVSEVTIRRDLERLEREGILIRTHGGAVLNEENTGNTAASSPVFPLLTPTDQDIVQTAFSLLNEGDVILLSGQMLVRQLATVLTNQKLKLTVLTNDLITAYSLRNCTQVNTVMLGGQLSVPEGASYGLLTQTNMANFHVSKMFFEVDAVSRQLAMTVDSTEKAEFLQKAFSIASEKILLCPSSRFDHTAFFRVGEISSITTLVSDSNLSDFYKEAAFQRDLRLYTSLSLYEFPSTS